MITKQSNSMKPNEKLRNLKNEAFPPKLEFGCEVITGNEYEATHHKRRIGNERLFEGEKYEGHTGYWVQLNENSSASIVKNLGLPVSWGEMLWMLNEKCFNDVQLFFGQSGNATGNRRILNIVHKKMGEFDLDLKKAPEQQDPKIIEQLISILK